MRAERQQFYGAISRDLQAENVEIDRLPVRLDQLERAPGHMIWAAAISAWAPFRGGPSAPPRQRSHPLCKAPAGDDGAAQSSPVKEESKVRSLQDLLGAVESCLLYTSPSPRD